jgi:2'-5' RNA ligase
MELRRHLDPRVARLIPPHVTIVYDDEAPDAGLLVDRLQEACADLAPITLTLSHIKAFGAPSAGLYVAAEASPSFEMLRAWVLRPPFARRGSEVHAHITLLHPKSVADAPADWQCHIGAAIDWTTTVHEVIVIQSNGGPWSEHARLQFLASDTTRAGGVRTAAKPD